MRKPCKECPHVIKSLHNEKFKGYMKKLNKKEHGCHMVDPKNILGVQTEKTKCVGECEK